MGKEIEEVKTLIMIGGLPCLACLCSFLIAFKVYPDDGEAGMKFVGLSVFVFSVIAIGILFRRIWKKLKELP